MYDTFAVLLLMSFDTPETMICPVRSPSFASDAVTPRSSASRPSSTLTVMLSESRVITGGTISVTTREYTCPAANAAVTSTRHIIRIVFNVLFSVPVFRAAEHTTSIITIIEKFIICFLYFQGFAQNICVFSRIFFRRGQPKK